MRIACISGSFREKSFNSALLRAARACAPKTVEFVDVDFRTVPLFNRDVETAGFPDAVLSAAEVIRKADGVLIATPEYNRSIPGVLKNFIDWMSRSATEDIWVEKPAAIIGASTGQLGTAVAQYDLKRVLAHLGARVMGSPEFFLNKAALLHNSVLFLSHILSSNLEVCGF